MTDRTTKFLLVMIAIALWGLLLRPFLIAPSAHAADNATVASNANTAEPSLKVASSNGILFVVRDNHFISAYSVGKPGEDATKTINFISTDVVH